jgi:hypothetical protein
MISIKRSLITLPNSKLLTQNEKNRVYYFKAIGSIFILKNGLKKICRKIYINHLRSNNYEVCTDVARCFPSILDAVVLENINLSEDEIGQPPLWSNETELDFCHQSLIYAVSCVYFNETLISYVHWT